MFATIRPSRWTRVFLTLMLPALAVVFLPGMLRAQAEDMTATANVAHFAPFGADVDGTSVTVRVNGADAITDFKFGDVIEDVELPAGEELLIEVLPTGTETVAISATVELDPDGAYTVAAIGGANDWELALLPLADETMAAESGALVRIGHLAPFADANTPDSTAVDICSDGAVLLPNVEYPQVTDYLPLPAGEYDNLQIALAGTDCATVALSLPPVELKEGGIVSVFAIGLLPDDANFPLSVSIDETPPTPATANVAHFAPFGADVDSTSVTVRVNGADAITDFKFGDVIEDVELPASEELLIEVLPTGTETVAISATVELDPAGAYTVAAIGGANDWELALLPLADETMAAESGALVRIGHLAPFADANTPDSTAVDICSDGAVLLPNVEYPQVTDYLPLPAGEYGNLQIALAGTDCETVALSLPAVELMDGDIGSVFAIGLLPDDANFPLDVWTDLPLAPATVNVAHFAPFGSDVDSTSVTVRVNGADAITDFKFGDVIKDVELPAGEELLLEVLPTGTETVAISATVELDPAGAYTVAAIGGANDWELALLPLVDETVPAESGALVRIGHLAPFADANTPGSTAVDICTDAGSAILEDVEYPQVTGYLELPAGGYDLLIALAGTNCETVALDLPPVTLLDGNIVDVFAIGLLPDDENFPLSAYVDGLSSFIYFPFVAAE